MIKASALPLTLFLLGATCLAQDPAYEPAPACPVAFTANISGRAIDHRAAESGRAPASSQLLEFAFGHGIDEITEMTIVVHGVDTTRRILPAQIPPAGDQTESFHLIRNARTGVFNSQVWLVKLGTINQTEITAMTFTDGSKWTTAKANPCTSRASLFKRVNATAY